MAGRVARRSFMSWQGTRAGGCRGPGEVRGPVLPEGPGQGEVRGCRGRLPAYKC